MISLIATRDLTSVLLDYRNSQKKKSQFEFNDGLFDNFTDNNLSSKYKVHLSAGNGKLNEGRELLLDQKNKESIKINVLSKLPPLWIEKVGEVQEEINRIKENMSLLLRLQRKKLYKIFSPADNSKLDQNIMELSNVVAKSFKKSEEYIVKILNNEILFDMNNIEFTLRKNAQKSLAEHLRLLSNQFETQQKVYLKEVRKKTMDENQTEMRSMGQNEINYGDKLLIQSEYLDDLCDVDGGIMDQNKELAKLAKIMVELHDIFKNVSKLVVEQGTIFDRIDYNLEQTAYNTKRARKQISKAAEKLNNKTVEKCIHILLGIISIQIILVVLKYST